MPSKRKPKLTLISGKDAQNVDVVILLFEKLLGRKCTQQEIDDARNFKPKPAIKAPQR